MQLLSESYRPDTLEEFAAAERVDRAIQSGHVFVFTFESPRAANELAALADTAVLMWHARELGAPYEQCVLDIVYPDRRFRTLVLTDRQDGSLTCTGFIRHAGQGWFLGADILIYRREGEPRPRMRVYHDTAPATDCSSYAPLLVPQVMLLLLLIADSRIPAERIVPGEKLNRARLRRGKPPIAPHWKIDARAAASLYTTRLGAPRRVGGVPPPAGRGTHASPIPHERRGHPRRLSSGKMVWVRPCYIGALGKHLTRRRDHYEIETAQQPDRREGASK